MGGNESSKRFAALLDSVLTVDRHVEILTVRTHTRTQRHTHIHIVTHMHTHNMHTRINILALTHMHTLTQTCSRIPTLAHTPSHTSSHSHALKYLRPLTHVCHVLTHIFT